MKIDILIVDLVLVILVLLPFMIFILLGKRESKRLKSSFQNAVAKYALRVTHRLDWNTNMFGLDKEQQKLLFIRERNDQFLTNLIDLHEVRSSRIVTVYQENKPGKGSGNLQRVDLELIYSSEEHEFFNLFDSEEAIYQDHELAHAEKLNALINEVTGLRPPTLHRAA